MFYGNELDFTNLHLRTVSDVIF